MTKRRSLSERAVREHRAAERATLPTMAESMAAVELTPAQVEAERMALEQAEALFGGDHGLEVIGHLDGGTPAILAESPDADWSLVGLVGHTGFTVPCPLVMAARQPVRGDDGEANGEHVWATYADGWVQSLADLGRLIDRHRELPMCWADGGRIGDDVQEG